MLNEGLLVESRPILCDLPGSREGRESEAGLGGFW